MPITILGCGTSSGVPVIGCRCAVCVSPEPRNRRTRSSALVRTRGLNILIDTSTDLRAQSLANGVERIDAVLFTHPHADHIHGIDELRAFNHVQGGPIQCYGSGSTIERIRRVFDYIFAGDEYGGWKPNLKVAAVDGPFEHMGVGITPIEVLHGSSVILGWRIGGAAYLTDCSHIPDASGDLIKGVDTLIIGALRFKPHPAHFSVEQAIEAAEAIRPERTVLTHLSHSVDYRMHGQDLPPGVELAYDGMSIDAP
jgi:phosphoribosyl 1,2-cyclic phosphate phosphodiesterase